MFTTALGFVVGNAKLFIYGAILVSVLTVGWKFVSVIQENAVKDAAIEIQRVSLEEKDKAIQSLEDLIKLNEEILEERDIELEDLANQLEGLTENLGDDSEDQAPESIKELFRRLK